MIVCQCKGVNDRAVRCALEGGADSLAGVERACGAGGACGGCRPLLAALVAEHGPRPQPQPGVAKTNPNFSFN